MLIGSQKLASRKTPKRLKQAVDLLEKTLWHHGKCRYKLLRNLACPSKVCPLSWLRYVYSSCPSYPGKKTGDPLTAQSSWYDRRRRLPLVLMPVQELISEDSITLSQLPSTYGTHASANRTSSSAHVNLTQTSTTARKAKPRFAEFVCTHVEVFRYVRLVTKAVIPQRVWGSQHNFSVAMNGESFHGIANI